MITAVLVATKNLELTREWYLEFRQRFPEQLLTISCIDGEPDISEYVKSLADSNTKVFVGKPTDGHEVSFSENYNAALNLVETDKFVLIHNDMSFCQNFFEVLDKELDIVNGFINYTTFEPPVYIHHSRDGKIIVDWAGWNNFNSYALKLQEKPDPLEEVLGGFFRAGFVKDMNTVGGFDQVSFPIFCEDDDLVLRTVLANFHTYQSKWACAYHFVSKTSNTLNRATLEQYSNHKFCQKWGMAPFQIYKLTPEQLLDTNNKKHSGIVTSFEFSEPNYLELQKQIQYEKL